MKMNTIAAISTPAGTGGIGIVRMSGGEAIPIAEKLFRSNSGKALCQLKGYTGILGRVFDGQGDVDDAIAFVYRAPKSYTGEDVVEISCHGGVYAVRKALRLCLESGASPASPGEFTRRAFLNGKMDLTKAEAVADLIAAQGDSAMRAAMAARDGALSTALAEIVEILLEQSAHLAAWADYPEEEIEAVESGGLAGALRSAHSRMDALLRTWDRGRMIRGGIATAIVGKPNVGKSTLMNLLAGEGRSIVSEIPGTTRDVVRESVQLGDCVLNLADTAGIRETGDQVEKIGVEIAKRQMETAELVLAVFDSSDRLTEEDHSLLAMLRGKPCIAVINKVDLERELDQHEIRPFVSRVVTISARTGQGRDALEREVQELLGLSDFDPAAAMVNNERQRTALMEALRSVEEAIAVLDSGMTMDAVNVSIDYALDKILSLTGRRASDEVVDAVFSRFCVGK